MAELDRARRRFLGTSALAGMDPAIHKAWLNGCTNAAG